ncbi:MAG: hypothetical protein HOE54_02725, partial [Gammaproteobacteria bacterium]|nr:hypothetical protein [Gammaproteobacteria bacterium]
MKASVERLLVNYISAMAIIGLVYVYYQFNSYYLGFFSSTHVWPWFEISDQALFNYVVIAFAVLLPPYYATFDDRHETKSALFWRAVSHIGRRSPDEKEKVAVLATIVKAFFLPLMTAWFFANGAEFLRHTERFWQDRTFFVHGYWMLFNLLIFIDVAFFTLAYSIEHPRLRNEIKSVEPTLFGWAVAIICYPPFNGVTNQMLGWYSSDYPEIHNIWLRSLSGALILVLMSIYVWATIALNIKASNLTNRGIVTGGPYAYIRHPAYVCKNLSWWIGAIPILIV